MSRSVKLPRVIKGKRPQFFETPGDDLSLSMIMVLAQEISVLRARLDAFENIASAKGVILEDDLKNYHPSDETLADQEIQRQELLDRLFYLLHQQAAEVDKGETRASFQETIDEIATP